MTKLSVKFRMAFVFCFVIILSIALTSCRQTSKKIVFATFPGKEQAMKEIAEAYEKETGNEVVINILPRTGYRQALIGPLSAGSSDFDVVYIQNSWIAEFAEAGFIDPLDQHLSSGELKTIKADQFEGIYNAGIYNDKLWGLPWDLSTYFLFYRTDLIKNPPKTMDEYLEIAKRNTRSYNPNSPTKYGCVIQGSPERTNYHEWYYYLWSYGGDLFDEKGYPTLNSKQAIESLTFLYDMKTKHNVVPPDVGTYNFPEVLTAFQEGIAAMVIQWNSAYSTFLDKNSSPKIYDKFDFAMIPSYKTETGELLCRPYAQAWYLTVNKFSKNKKEAAAWIKYFTGEKASKIALKNGANPGSVKAWSDPEILKIRKDADVFQKTLEIAKMSPNLPELPAIEDKLAQALTFVLANEKTAEQALNEVNEEAIKILKQSGRIK